METPHLERFSTRTRHGQASIIRELLPLAAREGMISFGGGYPHPATFPLSRLSFEIAGSTVVLDGPALRRACQYGPTEGHPETLEQVIAWHRDKSGVELTADRLLMTNGTQEGLFLMAALLLDPGDGVILSEPAYPGAVAAFRCFTDNLIAVPMDEAGIDAIALGKILGRRRNKGISSPKLLYVNPSCHNPAGVSVPPSRRHELLGLAREFDLIVIEDDPYEMLKFRDEDRHPTMQSLDAEDRVVRLDSFSKILVPGFRLGYLSGPADVVGAIRRLKGSLNIHCSGIDQSMLAAYLREAGPQGLRSWIRKSCELYHRNFSVMDAALQEELAGLVIYHRPDGGFFLWVEARPAGGGGLDVERLVREFATETGILIIPGAGFSLMGALHSHFRLSFSQEDPDSIREGVRRLKALLARTPARTSVLE